MIFSTTSRGDRLDVSAMGELRIRHDRRGVGVHQDDFIAFLLQRLARLDAGVVELAALPDDDGAGADEEDFLDRSVFRHVAQQEEKVGKKVKARAV